MSEGNMDSPGSVHAPLGVRFVQFTDGAWDGENAAEEIPNLTAGWGAAEFECVREGTPNAIPMGQLLARARAMGPQPDSYHARLIGVKNGTVEDDPKSPKYIGAVAHTNNTGELTAVYEAVVSALTRASGAGSEIIWSDSLYAINMTTGKWRPKCTRNREIVSRLRGVWRRIQRTQRARPREVQATAAACEIAHKSAR